MHLFAYAKCHSPAALSCFPFLVCPSALSGRSSRVKESFSIILNVVQNIISSFVFIQHLSSPLVSLHEHLKVSL